MSSQNWSRNFRAEFQQRRGYDPLPYLPVMTGRIVQSLEISERFLWDLRQTAQELVVENHALRLKELGRRHGLQLSIEPYDMNPTADLNLGSAADVPMCEFWSKGHGFSTEYSCLEAVSIGHTGGAKIIAAESFTANDTDTWLQYPTVDEGPDRLGLGHGHQPPGVPSLPAPAGARSIPRHDDGSLRRALGADGNLVGHGARRITSILPAASTCSAAGCRWPTFSISRRRAPRTSSARPLPPRPATRPIAAAITLTASRRRCSIKSATVEGRPDRLSRRHDVPRAGPAPLRGDDAGPVAKKIKELVETGATVIGKPPCRSPSLAGYPQCDEEVNRLAAEIWGTAAEARRTRRQRNDHSPAKLNAGTLSRTNTRRGPNSIGTGPFHRLRDRRHHFALHTSP